MITFFCRTFLGSVLCLLLILAPTAFSADFKLTKDGAGKEEPIVIKSNTLEIDNEKKTVTFTGNVDARRDDWIMNCNKMILMYNDQKERGGTDSEKLRVDKIIARGAVKIRRTLGGEATAEEAIYYQVDERVVLTGNPVVKQGDDFVEGSKITLFLKENRSIVEGSEGNKVRAVIAPRSGTR
jgi:lipopolysaccharide export system protein LptA